jgi:uncharacterized protein (DUF1501 family)
MTTNLMTTNLMNEPSVDTDSSRNRLLVGRRKFLGGVAAGAAISVLPGWADHIAGAAPLNGGEGIVVVILMAGGNDGLNTFAPVSDGHYRDLRKSIALNPAQARDMGSGRAMHPSLPTVHRLWGLGQVAVVDGVAHPNATLSHFESMAQIMSGHASGLSGGGGWLGRYLDGLGGDVFGALAMGSSVPLTMRGNQRQAAAVQTKWGEPFGASSQNEEDRKLFEAIRSFGNGPQKGQYGPALAAVGRDSLDLAARVAPSIKGVEGDDLPRELTAVANLINANLGTRVFHIIRGEFDTHDDQAGDHAALLGELDRGVAAFYGRLDARWRGQVTLMTCAEFGRRPEANGSRGTDHGRANSWMMIGDGVRGGFHGALPSLTKLDDDGNFIGSVDARSVYANVLDGWLGADSREVLGGSFGGLSLFKSSPTSSGPPVAAAGAPKKKAPPKKKKRK